MTAGRDARLYGGAAAPAAPVLLRAGPLSVEFEAGNLRHIRLGSVELLRGVAFLVRTPRWATYEPTIGDLAIEQSDAAFRVSYRATVEDDGSRLHYTARIEGGADRLDFACDIAPQTDFATCRTGFVVLHPASVAGAAAEVEHAQGGIEPTRFPELIDPYQPMMDVRAITHEAAPGLRVTCRMDGDVFEMEDQRNWTDASFKTYVRPLSRPYPYVLAAGETSRQSVSLAVHGGGEPPGEAAGAARVTLGEALGPMPQIGLGCTPAEAREAWPWAARLRDLGIGLLVCRVDRPDAADLAAFRALAQAIGAAVELQVVAHERHEFARELHALAQAVRAADLAPVRVAVSPAPDLHSTSPGQTWPDCAPLDALYDAARDAFPGVPLAGGTFAFFTDLNRKRPPLGRLDAVTFATSPLVHAADDRSVMQSIEALPSVLASARAIAGDRPLLIGPSAIAFRDNPYGPAPLDNPGGQRLPMAGSDPRQRGLFNAAWTLGYVAACAQQPGVARVALSAPAGPHGVMDAAGAFPVAAVLGGLATLRGAVVRAVHATPANRIAALHAAAAGRQELWLGNLEAAPVTVVVPTAFQTARWSRLDAASLAASPGFAQAAAGERLEMDAYAVWRGVLS